MGALSGALKPNDLDTGTAVKQPQHASRWVLVIIIIVVTGAIALPPVLQWQRMSEERALSLSNMRRVAQGTLMYAQDWDSCTMPPAAPLGDRVWQTWPRLLRPYVTPDSAFSNPSNPVLPFHSSLRDPVADYPVDSSYAFNSRFWSTFSKGPFPLDNLEMQDQTALFVEAGRMWRDPLHFSPGKNVGLLEYGDTMDRNGRYCPYPSTHDSKMVVVAADGHGAIVSVSHYTTRDGPHDKLYGRIGSGIYNWNGGHPNGETDRPARE